MENLQRKNNIANAEFLKILFICFISVLFYGFLIFTYSGVDGRLPDGISILGYIDNVLKADYNFKWDFSDINNMGTILLFSSQVYVPFAAFIINMFLLFTGYFYFYKISVYLDIPLKYVLIITFLNSYFFYSSFTPNKETITFTLYSIFIFHFLTGQVIKSRITGILLLIVRPLNVWVFCLSFFRNHLKKITVLIFFVGIFSRFILLYADVPFTFIQNSRIHYTLYKGTYSADMILKSIGIEVTGFVLNFFEYLYNIVANLIGGFNTFRSLFIDKIYHPSIIAHFIQFISSLVFFIIFCFLFLKRRLFFLNGILSFVLIPLFVISSNIFPHSRYYYPFMPFFTLYLISMLLTYISEPRIPLNIPKNRNDDHND